MVAFVGFGGSRVLPPVFRPLVSACVRSVLAGGRGVSVGCAAGADAFVRSAAVSLGSRPAVFRASSFRGARVAALALRSAACVRFCAASGSGAGFVVFVSSPCPVGLRPAVSWVSGFGSGSWASAALAAGLGLPVVVFPLFPGCGAGAGVGLPPSWGRWVPAAASGCWSGGFRLVPWWVGVGGLPVGSRCPVRPGRSFPRRVVRPAVSRSGRPLPRPSFPAGSGWRWLGGPGGRG